MDIENARAVKRKRSEDSSDESSSEYHVSVRYTQCGNHILNMADDVLVHIFSFLDLESLFNVSKTCCRFKILLLNESLWINVDAREKPHTRQKNQFVWAHVHSGTKSILMSGESCVNVLLPIQKLIIKKIYRNLAVLALERQCIKYCTLGDFPTTLEELSLSSSFIPRQQEFFRYSLVAMSNLKTLLLDRCKWLDASIFMPLSRFPKLEILSLYMCTKLGDDDISIISVAGRLGFRTLKVIDLRFTGLGDLFIRTFYSNTSLQIIYLQNYPATYYKERWQRKIDMLGVAKRCEEDTCMSDDDENNLCKEVLTERFKSSQFVFNDTQTINDTSLEYFTRVVPTNIAPPRPASAIYKYPYNECTCGFQKIRTHIITLDVRLSKFFYKLENINSAPDVDNKCEHLPNCWDLKCLKLMLEREKVIQLKNRYRRNGSEFMYSLIPAAKTFCKLVVYDSCASPPWCHEEATPEYVFQNWISKREPRSEFEIQFSSYAEKNFKTVNQTRCENCYCDSKPKGIDIYESFITFTIHRFATFLHWMRCFNYEMDSASILRGFLKVFNISSLLAPLEDLELFGAELASLLTRLAKHKQNVHYVLLYHAACIKDVLQQLPMERSVHARQALLLYFFRNLVRVEEVGNSVSHKYHKLPKKRPMEFVPGKIKVQTAKKSSLCFRCTNHSPEIKEEVGATNITDLSFRGFYHITDSSLQSLKNLNLKFLDITGTSVTKPALLNFIATQPNCRVLHDAACVCSPNLHF